VPLILLVLLRRMAVAVPVIFGSLLLTFLLVRTASNDPVGLLAGPTATAEEVAAIRHQLQLDQPVWRQFATFANGVVHGQLGRSWLDSRPVLDDLLERLPASLELVLLGAGLGAAVGVPLGLASALHANGPLDYACRVASLFGFGMPTMFLGLLAVFVFFYLLGWAPPPMGRLDLIISAPPRVTGSYLLDALIAGDREAAHSAAARLVLPVLCVATVYAAPLIKQARAIALDVLASDHLRYAEAVGLPDRMIRRIVRRNSAVPLITFMATELTAVFGTAAVLELIFSWGGMSQFALVATLQGDFAVVQGYVIAMALIATLIFLLSDLAVLWLEPRARLR
jgi:ABC-type dipeptide/oligopeptide/nickel transport system permease component